MLWQLLKDSWLARFAVALTAFRHGRPVEKTFLPPSARQSRRAGSLSGTVAWGGGRGSNHGGMCFAIRIAAPSTPNRSASIVARSSWIVALFLTMSAGNAALAFASPSMTQDDAAVQAPAGDQAPAPAPGNETAAPKVPKTTVLEWLYNSLGIAYILVFLGMSFVLVGLIITIIISSRRERVCPAALVTGFESLLDEKKYQDAYELAKADESFLGNVLSTGLSRINSGYEKAVEAMQEAGQEESMKIQHTLSYLALIGSIGPMVGLFGTVDGMIRAFYEIATAGGSPDPQKLADGISKALVTTLIGLAIAIPAIVAFSIFRNRYERLELEVGNATEGLMNRFEGVGKTREPA